MEEQHHLFILLPADYTQERPDETELQIHSHRKRTTDRRPLLRFEN
jgi:hypothetical protein